MLLEGSPREKMGYGTFAARGGDELKQGFEELEYTQFPVAHEKASRLLRRCLIIINELAMGGGVGLLPPLATVLKSAIFLLLECRTEVALSERMVLLFSYSQYFIYLNKCLQKVWACPPSWNHEELGDEETDTKSCLEYLRAGCNWEHLSGKGELWGKLSKLSENFDEAKNAVVSQFTRRSAVVDLRDITLSTQIIDGEYCTISTAGYRGTAVVLKEIKKLYISHENITSCLMRASHWIGAHHPHIVPLVGCAVMKGYGADETPGECAVMVTRFAPGTSLYELWYTDKNLPDIKQLLTLCRQAAEALLYLTLVPTDNIIPYLPADNCMIDSGSGSLRIILPMFLNNKTTTRWHPPVEAVSPLCYMVGLLLWCGATGSIPLPHLNDMQSFEDPDVTGNWHPVVVTSQAPVIGEIVVKATALKGEEGFGSLARLIAALNGAIASSPHNYFAPSLTDSSIPHPLNSLPTDEDLELQ